MEEQRQLPASEGGCWTELSALLTGEESNPRVAFLRQLLAVVGSRGDKDYTENVVHDLTISLLQGGHLEEAKMMSGVELGLRRAKLAERKAKLAERKERENKASGMQQSFNVNVSDGSLKVENLQTDQVLDIHNNGLIFEENGGKGKFH